MIAVRRALPSDAATAARIIQAGLREYGIVFDPGGRDADVAMFGARDEHDDFVAEADGVPIGIVSVGAHGDPGVAWISKLFVSSAARRSGVGRALMEAAHEAARARGYREVALRTRVVFRDAIRLYEKLGYARRDDPRVLESGDVVLYRAL
jgi:GNAT superfamily N-acetyltransferase